MAGNEPDKAIEQLESRRKRLDDMLIYEAGRLAQMLTWADQARSDIMDLRKEKDDVDHALLRLRQPRQRDPRYGGRD